MWDLPTSHWTEYLVKTARRVRIWSRSQRWLFWGAPPTFSERPGFVVFRVGFGLGIFWNIVGPQPLEGRCVLYTSGGRGGVGVGHVITFMWTCGGRTCLSVAAGRCMYARVGWGGACNNVHVNLWRKDMLLCKFSGTFHSCVMPRYVSSLELSTHTSCYLTLSSLELSTHASCHAIVSSLELSTHTSCYITVSSLELSTHVSCHAIVSSLELSMCSCGAGVVP